MFSVIVIQSLSRVQLFATPGTAARQALLTLCFCIPIPCDVKDFFFFNIYFLKNLATLDLSCSMWDLIP